MVNNDIKMEDFSHLRTTITKNYLKNLLIRVDFDDIVDFDIKTEKIFTNYLREKNYTDNKGQVNELNLSITLKDNSFSQCNTETRRAFVFNNECEKVRIEITPSAILLVKYGNFKEYSGLDKYKQIFLDVFNEINKNEHIYLKKISIKKIDNFETSNVSIFNDIFDEFITYDFMKNPLTDRINHIAKMINFPIGEYNVNYLNRLFKGAFFVKDKFKDGYQFLMEVEMYKDINIRTEQLDKDITSMNNSLFNIFMTSFSSAARDKIKNNIPIINEEDE